jgi:hypothetical protein
VRSNVLRRHGVGVFIVLSGAVAIVLLPAYVDHQWRREAELKNFACHLPWGLTLDSTFCEPGFRFHGRTMERFPVITVRQKLLELGARWDRGALRDGSGREIYFFGVPEHGNPSREWMEMAEKKFAELQVLKRQYNVVVMYATREPM